MRVNGSSMHLAVVFVIQVVKFLLRAFKIQGLNSIQKGLGSKRGDFMQKRNILLPQNPILLTR